MIPKDYQQKIEKWHAERETSLRRENGWLALAGLYWLQEGENRLGSAAGNEILLPARFPAFLGSMMLQNGEAFLKVDEALGLKINGEPATQTPLNTDRQHPPSYITLDGIRMVVIDRPTGMGLRLWDNLRKERMLHAPRQWFPVNESLRLPARYERYETAHKVPMPDVFGDMVEGSMDGQVSFEVNGQTFTLEASEDDGRLEIRFQDLTNSKTTYPSGRYYYDPEPVQEGNCILDFNYSYSPPCAFTPFATCAFAPLGNHLPIPIEAGEIFAGH